jgi:tight adherence protein C
MDPVLLFAVLLFATLALGVLGIAAAASQRQERRRIVEKIRGEKAVQAVPEAGPPPPDGGSGVLRVLTSFAAAIGLKLSGGQAGSEPSNQRQLFLQAGFRGEHALAAFLGFKVLGAAALTAGGIFWRVTKRPSGSELTVVLIIVALALLGWYLPDIVLRLRIAHRKELLLEGFPDALDLMVVCVESGMGLDAAVTRVGEEMRLSSPRVSDEFRLLSLELRAGKMRRDALHSLAMRTGLEEISSFASLLIQTDRFGTSVAQALRVHADSMRVRRAQRAEELAAKLPVKLVFPLVFFIFPCIFVVVVGPAVIKIVRTFSTVFK